MGKLLEIKVSRTAENGLQFFIKSQQDWSAIGNKAMACKIGGVECYYPHKSGLDDCPGCRFGVDDVFDYGDGPNLTMLLAKNIQNGVTFNFGKYPISQEKIQSWVQVFKDQVKYIYLTYIKEVDISIVLSTSVVENERHD